MLRLLCRRLDLAVMVRRTLIPCLRRFGSFVSWLSLLERRERYFASAPELIVMQAALSSALKVLTLTPRFLALRNSSRRCAS